MFLAFLMFVAVNAFYLALIGFVLYRVSTYLRGNEWATSVVVQHVLVPIFAGTPKKVEPEVVDEPKTKIKDELAEWTPEEVLPDAKKEVF